MTVDPLFSGFTALPDNQLMAVDDLLRSRHAYFKEGVVMAETVVKAITASRRLLYYDRKEFREQRRLGIAFFIVTCLLDALVCSL